MNEPTLTRESFSNQNEVRWCPGCGDYAILAAIQKILPELGLPPEKHVFISGIGCAGRLPYYMNTYGFHTIHGRAPAIATGLSALRDDVCVWIISGDGDALSIGGNHLIHSLRRNLNVNILLINNQVYGLTKGQFSPTSQKGQVTKTTPQGVSSQPMNPLTLALGAGASFVARAIDKDPNLLGSILKEAYAHQGCSLVEIYQDCHIFNAGVFDEFSAKTNRSHNTFFLQEGEPLIYGAQKEWALEVKDDLFNKVESHSQLQYKHQPENYIAAMRLASLTFPEYPVGLGIYYKKSREIYSLKQTISKSKLDLEKLYRSRTSWSQ
jgi:2-oxoglutarate ferredoxin oxidoreductase subunit beta